MFKLNEILVITKEKSLLLGLRMHLITNWCNHSGVLESHQNNDRLSDTRGPV